MKHIVFIDGNNFYSTLKSINKQVDYTKIAPALSPVPMRSIYYSTLRPETEGQHDPLRPLLDFLEYNGYQVHEKYLMEYPDDRGGMRFKGSMIPDMTVDLMELPPTIDAVTIFSGDGDLVRAVQAIQRRGIHVRIVSEVDVCSDALRRQCDRFQKLSEMTSIFMSEDVVAQKKVLKLKSAA